MIAYALQSLIRLYKKTFSPALLSTCRFTPTCADYALEALERHGSFAGGALAIWRTLRCNPFTRGGLDTVPTKLRHHDIRIHTCQVGDRKNFTLAGERRVGAVSRDRAASVKPLATETLI